MHTVTGDPLVPTRAVPTRALGIGLGALIDAVIGDPRRGHPVAAFGRWASVLERKSYARSRARGAGYAAVAVAGPVLLGLAAEKLTDRRPIARVIVTALATWVSLGGTSLAREGAAMATALELGDLPGARRRLTHLCARDPAELSALDLTRATVESMAENTSDAVVAPLFWAALAGPAGVLGYRAINTLDAMVGYRSQRYVEFGWACARLDDLVNLAPARLTGVLTVACAPLVGGSPAAAWRVLRSDGGRHPSPNAGRCEASAAGALGVQLGGTNVYGGQAESRPVVGAQGRSPGIVDVRRAARLGRYVGLAGAGLAVVVSAAWSGRVLGRSPGWRPRRVPGPVAGRGSNPLAGQMAGRGTSGRGTSAGGGRACAER
jgi:adenosylcobinamide-phosphate synthase